MGDKVISDLVISSKIITDENTCSKSMVTSSEDPILTFNTTTSGVEKKFFMGMNASTGDFRITKTALVTDNFDETETEPPFMIGDDGKVTITGDLDIKGTSTAESTTNTTIVDRRIELNTGQTGNNENDCGIIIERGDLTNAFMGWDESADYFVFGTTAATGATTGKDLTVTPGTLVSGKMIIGADGTTAGDVTIDNTNNGEIIWEGATAGDNNQNILRAEDGAGVNTLPASTGTILTTAAAITVAQGGTGATTTTNARTALGVDPSGTDNSTDVTLATVTSNYLTLSDQEITAGTVPVTLGGTGATTATNARTALGVGPKAGSTDIVTVGTLTGLTVESGNTAINISNDTADTTVHVGTGAGVKTCTIGSTNSASKTTIQSGTLDIGLSSAGANITIDTVTNNKAISLGTSGKIRTINIGNTVGVQTINVGADDTPENIITVGGTSSKLGFFGVDTVVKYSTNIADAGAVGTVEALKAIVDDIALALKGYGLITYAGGG